MQRSEARVSRRAAVGLVLIFGASITTVAWAGSYLNRSELLVRQAVQESKFLQYRLRDRELARMIYAIANGRLAAARDMTVPDEVVQAHPHLLLMLENFERAAAAAKKGEAERFIVYHRRGLDEEQIFRGILRQLGFPLPDDKR